MCTCIFSKLWPTPTPPTGHVSKKLSSKPQQPLRLSRSSRSVSTSSPEARLKSKTEAEAKAEERAQRVKHYTEAETDYRAGLNDQMLRLELANPVGPRTGVPLVSDHRLKQEIEAGRSVWVARRAQRARERAAQRRQEVDAWSRAEKGPGTGPLLDVDLAEAGKVLDKALHDAAQRSSGSARDKGIPKTTLSVTAITSSRTRLPRGAPWPEVFPPRTSAILTKD